MVVVVYNGANRLNTRTQRHITRHKQTQIDKQIIRICGMDGVKRVRKWKNPNKRDRN